MIAVVIPCYRCSAHVLGVLAAIGPEVGAIYVVDDACPEGTGDVVASRTTDDRVKVIRRARNGGVGAAVVTGFERALADGADIVVKLDGDGQMDPAEIPRLVHPIRRQQADYVKANRFFAPDYLAGMPGVRIFGNAVLSFLSKLSSGYWNIFDPTNGFIAIDAGVLSLLPLDKIAPDFLFESDMLFRLSILRARVVDIPLRARYGDECSNLKVAKVILPFIRRLSHNFIKRLAYSYFIRDFSLGSIYVAAGVPLTFFGLIYGAVQWYAHALASPPVASSTGVIMLAALPLILGMQFLIAFFTQDVISVPATAIHPALHPSVRATTNKP
ncbi:MAG: glycosyltransferase family 2 protein [Rhizobiales bacterium]|nr:glycosyltransferase family 2 protein [Hyphomicrobiales bacterium]